MRLGCSAGCTSQHSTATVLPATDNSGHPAGSRFFTHLCDQNGQHTGDPSCCLLASAQHWNQTAPGGTPASTQLVSQRSVLVCTQTLILPICNRVCLVMPAIFHCTAGAGERSMPRAAAAAAVSADAVQQVTRLTRAHQVDFSLLRFRFI